MTWQTPLAEAYLLPTEKSYILRSLSCVLNNVLMLDLRQDRLIFVELLLPYTLISAKAGRSWEGYQYISAILPRLCKVCHIFHTRMLKSCVLFHPRTRHCSLPPLMTTEILTNFSS